MTDKQSSDAHTPAYKIFHYFIHVWVPVAFVNTWKRDLVGSVIYKTEEMEREAAADRQLMQLTVADMAELVDQGASLVFHKPEDTVKVYQWLNDHLRSRRRDMEWEINTKQTPIDDLRKLDQLADFVYSVARNYQNGDIRESASRRKLEELFGRRRSLSRTPVENKQPDTPRAPPQHQSLMDEISAISMDRQLEWSTNQKRRK